MKNIIILGSTGSIGIQTLDIVENFSDKFRVVGITAYKNLDLLLKQIEEFKPEYVGIYSYEDAKIIKDKYKDIEVFYGNNYLLDILDIEFDVLVNSVVGFVGLQPTLKALKKAKIVALANKETLVTGGPLVNFYIKKYNGRILPIDSEHSAIFQSISNQRRFVKNIILTASGGPFWKLDKKDFVNIKYEDVFKHPVWDMGKKITVDSATFANKGLEVIEAKYLFNISQDNIKVYIHPQAIVHSGVEFIDGSFVVQMSNPDMHLPILYALTYPQRYNYTPQKPLDLAEVGQLNFYRVDIEKFKALKLAFDCAKQEHGYPIVFNSVNEVAVDLFINKKITFTDITKLIERVIYKHKPVDITTLEDILAVDTISRQLAYKEAEKL